jgi:hypothetical protein
MSRLTRWLLHAAVAASALAFADAASAEKYVVLYKQQAVPADAARTVERAGGTLIAAYDEIGVAISESSKPSFRANLMQDKRIDGASPTSRFGAEVAPVEAASHDEQDPELPNAPATDADTFSSLQWDMRQIHTPEAHAVTGGSPAVVVGDIDMASTRTIPTCCRTSTSRAAPPARAVRPIRTPPPGTIETGTARTPPARSRLRRTASASSALRRTSSSPASSRRTTPASSSRRW